MIDNLTEISKHFISKLITSEFFNSSLSVKYTDLLLPGFYDKLKLSIAAFNIKYPQVEVLFVETYRSNILQQHYYNAGASKIKKDGMHHFGIAADLAFLINGKFSYKGDYEYLRECHEKQGFTLLGAWDIGHVQFIPVSSQENLRTAVYNAVKKFQRDNNLISDGIPGPKTIAKAKEVFK